MPRKTQEPPRPDPRPSRFNEAAARCRGKQILAPDFRSCKSAASMRPRPDAAENSSAASCSRCSHRRFNEAAARCRGKRRWSSSYSAPPRCFNEAAARCRGKRAPCSPRRTSARCFNEAAARCRGKRRPCNGYAGQQGSFNEAAARCRGKLRRLDLHGRPERASMRPRPDAAENAGPGAAGRHRRGCFNEAAARCRGKPDGSVIRYRRPSRFNEAAARCRGKLLVSLLHAVHVHQLQ